MHHHIAERWAAKLKSGDIQQCGGALRRGDAMCCLGVLCELFREETGDGEWGVVGREPIDFSGAGVTDAETFLVGGECYIGVLPHAVRSWAGMSSQKGQMNVCCMGDPESDVALTYLNDKGKSFSEIAGVIMENCAVL